MSRLPDGLTARPIHLPSPASVRPIMRRWKKKLLCRSGYVLVANRCEKLRVDHDIERRENSIFTGVMSFALHPIVKCFVIPASSVKGFPPPMHCSVRANERRRASRSTVSGTSPYRDAPHRFSIVGAIIARQPTLAGPSPFPRARPRLLALSSCFPPSLPPRVQTFSRMTNLA